MEPVKFVEIEPRVVPENLRQIEHLHDVLHRHDFAILPGRPAEQTQIIHDRFRREPLGHITRQRRALVALAHLRAVGVQDERDVGILRRFDAECAKQRDVLRGVAQVVFAADHVRDAHLQIVHHVDEMKHRLAVGTNQDKIGIQPLAIRQFAAHVADHEVRDDDRLARHFELHRAFVLVSEALVFQFLHAFPVNLRTLRLKVRPVRALAGRHAALRRLVVAARRPYQWSFIPFETEPAQAVQDNFDRFLRVAGHVGVFDAENERAARMAGVEPVEQRRAGAADVQKTGRTRSKTDANVHRSRFKVSGARCKARRCQRY